MQPLQFTGIAGRCGPRHAHTENLWRTRSSPETGQCIPKTAEGGVIGLPVVFLRLLHYAFGPALGRQRLRIL